MNKDQRGYPYAVCDGTKGVWAGGDAAPYSNIIDYINIASVGNASDFGDLLDTYTLCGGSSGD